MYHSADVAYIQSWGGLAANDSLQCSMTGFHQCFVLHQKRIFC